MLLLLLRLLLPSLSLGAVEERCDPTTRYLVLFGFPTWALR